MLRIKKAFYNRKPTCGLRVEVKLSQLQALSQKHQSLGTLLLRKRSGDKGKSIRALLEYHTDLFFPRQETIPENK